MAGIALGQSIFQMSWVAPDPSFEVVSSGLFSTAQSGSFAKPTEERHGDPAMLLRQI